MARKRVSQKELAETLVATLKKWQKIEDKSISSIKGSMKQLKNPLVKQIFQIIAHDSAMHRKVQQFIIDTLEKKAITLTPEDVAEIGTILESHIELEKETVELGAVAKASSKNFIHQYLINYLLVDERKHDDLLEQLGNIKDKIYPYA